MEYMAVLLLIGVFLTVVVLLSRPFVNSYKNLHGSDQALSVLVAERERLLAALRELEFDHDLGKIPHEDFPEQRAELVKQGADVMQKIDNLSQTSKKSEEITKDEDLDYSDDAVENLVSKRRLMQAKLNNSFCPKCGKPIVLADHFCPGCGFQLSEK